MSDEAREKITKLVDVEFCEKVLRQSENDPSIKVTGMAIKPATNKGDNYTSDMFRATIEYEAAAGERLKKSIIVKVEPMAEGIHKDLISKSTLFGTEIMMMTDTLAKMNDLLGSSAPKLNGRGLFTQKSDPPLLVIEDLAPLGFRMADRQLGLDADHCLLAIRGLARFHASSVALCEKEPEQKERYARGMFNMDQPREMHMFFIEGAKALARECANWPELDPKYAEKIAGIAERMYEKGIEASVRKPGEFNVINHGDFWVNNMLFKYDEDGRPISHIFVDFQLCFYASPAVDLQYFFNTSLTDDMLVQQEEKLLAEYLKTLSDTMATMGCSTKPPTMGELKAMLKDRALFGMVSSFTILPILLVDKSQAKDLNEMMSGEVYENPGYKGAAFKKAMLRRLPKFHEMGLLD